MSTEMPTHAEMERVVYKMSLEKSWTFADAEELLCIIQLYNLSRATDLDENIIDSTAKETTSFLEKGLRDGKLNDINSNMLGIPKEYIQSAAIALTASTSPAITPALTMISPFASLASAAIPFIVKKISTSKKDTKQVVLKPSEVIAYAKLHGKWLGSEEQPAPEESHIAKMNRTDINLTEHSNDSESNKIISHQETIDSIKPIKKSRNAKTDKPSTCIKGTEAAKQMANNRWAPNRQVKERIKNYIEAEATKPNCTCLARHMLDIVMEAFGPDDKLIADSRKLSEPATFKYIKYLFAENQIDRSCNGRPPKNTCPIHVKLR